MSTTQEYEGTTRGSEGYIDDHNEVPDNYVEPNENERVHEEHMCAEDGDDKEEGADIDDDGCHVDGNVERLAADHEKHAQSGVRMRSRSPRSQPRDVQRPVAMIHGGIMYVPDGRMLTERALRRHQRLMSRDDMSQREQSGPPSQPGSSTPSDVLITSMAWPTTPPPAQPDMVPRPIEDDLGAVGAAQAYPFARAADVVEDIIKEVRPTDLVQVIPLAAYHWRDVEKIIIPAQSKVEAYSPVDLRISRWELYQEIRQVPIMFYGKVIRTILLPWHVTLEDAMDRIENRAPPHKHWLLTAVSPQNWVLHQLMLPEHVREELCELDQLRERATSRLAKYLSECELSILKRHNSGRSIPTWTLRIS